jgi:hypothetical protein
MKMYSTPKITNYIKDMAAKLNRGQIIAIHADSTNENEPSFVFFIIRESDDVIKALGKTPQIQAIAGMINVQIGKQIIWCVPTLFRFCGNSELVYSLEYNLAMQESLSTYCALGRQPSFDFLFCGETQDKAITANLGHFHEHVSENIEIAKQQTTFNWNDDAYLSAMQVINDVNSSELWEVFQQNGSLLELRKNNY